MALKNIPSPDFYTDSFWAGNLLRGLAPRGTGSLATLPPIGIAFCLLGGVAAIWRVQFSILLLDSCGIDWMEWTMRCLATASILIVACFFAAPNIDYRGVYLLLTLPGLTRLDKTNDQAKIWASRMIYAVLFVLWSEFFRVNIKTVIDLSPHPLLRNFVEIVFWICRELVW